MSASLAAAKKRRANIQDAPRAQPPTQSSMQSSNPPIGTGLTLPQVIQIVDNRLIVLEKFMAETKMATNNVYLPNTMNTMDNNNNNVSTTSDKNIDAGMTPVDISDVIEEFDGRYNMLVEEIANLKNIVLSLQSYTMEVNKTLLSEKLKLVEVEDEPAENGEVQ